MDVLEEKESDVANNAVNIETLVSQSQLGESKALEELLKIYERLIYKISKKYYFQDGEAEDVIQECKIAFWSSVMNYNITDKPSSLETFAYICINRKLSSVLRNRNNKGNILHNEAMMTKSLPKKDFYNYEYERNLFLAKDDIENEYIFNETKKEYIDIVNKKVSSHCGEIVKLREEGYSYKEIGEILKLSTKKVDNTMIGIRKKLNSDDFLN